MMTDRAALARRLVGGRRPAREGLDPVRDLAGDRPSVVAGEEPVVGQAPQRRVLARGDAGVLDAAGDRAQRGVAPPPAPPVPAGGVAVERPALADRDDAGAQAPLCLLTDEREERRGPELAGRAPVPEEREAPVDQLPRDERAGGRHVAQEHGHHGVGDPLRVGAARREAPGRRRRVGDGVGRGRALPRPELDRQLGLNETVLRTKLLRPEA